MDNINPKTGKRLGKFLWVEQPAERAKLLAELQQKVNDGFYSTESVLSSIVNELAPAISSNLGVEVVQ